jgi:sugar lactone lactonase YvrE
MPTVRFDDGLGALVGAEPWELVADGLGFTEGPVWHRDGYLLFSDIPNSRIYRWRSGRLEVYREPTGQSNGLTFDGNMHLIACEHQNRRVSIERGGGVEPLATHVEGKRLNSPNDVVVRSDGRIFFTDPPYGITEDQRELRYNGVFTISTSGGGAARHGLRRPRRAITSDTPVIAELARNHVSVSGGAISNGASSRVREWPSTG